MLENAIPSDHYVLCLCLSLYFILLLSAWALCIPMYTVVCSECSEEAQPLHGYAFSAHASSCKHSVHSCFMFLYLFVYMSSCIYTFISIFIRSAQTALQFLCLVVAAARCQTLRWAFGGNRLGGSCDCFEFTLGPGALPLPAGLPCALSCARGDPRLAFPHRLPVLPRG